MVIGRGRRREHPMDTSKGSRDLRSLRMLHNFRLRTLKGTPKGSSDLRQPCHFRSNYPIRADIAQLPVAHAQNILPDRFISGHVTDVASGHVNSGHAQWSDPPHDPPQILICPSPYTTDIFTDVVIFVSQMTTNMFRLS